MYQKTKRRPNRKKTEDRDIGNATEEQRAKHESLLGKSIKRKTPASEGGRGRLKNLLGEEKEYL